MGIRHLDSHACTMLCQRLNPKATVELREFPNDKGFQRRNVHLVFHLLFPRTNVTARDHERPNMTMLKREDAASVATLTMDAPERLNALSDAMLAALQETLDDIGQDETVRAVIIRGTGKAFCAGHDLKEMQAGRQAEDAGAA